MKTDFPTVKFIHKCKAQLVWTWFIKINNPPNLANKEGKIEWNLIVGKIWIIGIYIVYIKCIFMQDNDPLKAISNLAKNLETPN